MWATSFSKILVVVQERDVLLRLVLGVVAVDMCFLLGIVIVPINIDSLQNSPESCRIGCLEGGTKTFLAVVFVVNFIKAFTAATKKSLQSKKCLFIRGRGLENIFSRFFASKNGNFQDFMLSERYGAELQVFKVLKSG